MDKSHFTKRVAERVRCDEQRADGLVFAVFQELRERLTPREAADVATQLPAALRRMWLENERSDRVVRRTHQEEFIGRVRNLTGLSDDIEAERAVKAVFSVLQEALGSPTGCEGEAWDILSQLPKDLKMLWLTAHEESRR
jgi:uncharacterized protein (DUF2267 family)